MNLAPTQHKNNHLHHDLVFPILLKLPAKSLFRFKLLSNFWHDQISNPYFQDMYHKQAKKNPNFLFCRNIFRSKETGAENKTKNVWKSFNSKTRLVNDAFTTMGKVLSIKTVTCQSMVCFLSTKNDNDIQVSLYCFRTEKLVVLPMDPSSGFYKGMIIGFGIGYISYTKTYKVALLYIPDDETNQMLPNSFNCQIIEVSNSHDGDGNRNYSNWRKIEETFYDLVNNFHPPVSIENTTYWKFFNHACILSFDFENENFGIKYYPDEIDFSFNKTDNMFLLDFNGKLGLAEVCSKSHESYFTMVIWNLHDHGANNWEKVYRVSLKVTRLNFLRGLSCMYLQDEEIIISSIGCLILYNLKKHTFKILDIDVSTNHTLVGMYYENLYI